MPAIYHNFFNGTITDNPLSAVATTINSAGFADLPVITSPDFTWMTLDPLGVGGDPEIVKVTAHTAAATSITVTRGQQTTLNGSVARSHLQGTAWRWAATAEDYEPLIRRRQTRGAFNYPTGDSDINGTLTTVENVGGITGAGTSATPNVVPSEGSYAISAFFFGTSFPSGANAILIIIGGANHAIPLQNGTALRVGGTIVKRLAASGAINFVLRNNTGASMNGVQFEWEIVKVVKD